jgi:hypothetical protein
VKTYLVRIGAAAILTISLMFAVSCGGSTGCVSNEIPASWTSLGITPLEGGSVCTYSDEWVTFEHPGIIFPELYDKYKPSLESAGWTVGELVRSSKSFTATKGVARLSVRFQDCTKSLTRPSTWSLCTDAVMQKR